MEPVAPVTLAITGGSRAAGWQTQLRVDYVVNKITQTHRGRAADDVEQALLDQLRSLGVVPNARLMAQYAEAIARLPLLPPDNSS